MTSKYDPITQLLLSAAERGDREITISFDHLDSLIPGGLPASAREHRAWWANSSQYGSAFWAPFGWEVDAVDQSASGWVRFRRADDFGPVFAATSRHPPQRVAAPVPAPSPRCSLAPVPSKVADSDCATASAMTDLETDVHVLIAWIDAGPIAVDSAGRLAFPALPPLPGVYRFELFGAPGQTRTRVYIGETDLLFRRMVGYRTPGPTQSTNIRLNTAIAEHLMAEGRVALAVATSALVQTGGQDQPLQNLDLSLKFARGLAENAALVTACLSGDVELVNAGEARSRGPAA